MTAGWDSIFACGTPAAPPTASRGMPNARRAVPTSRSAPAGCWSEKRCSVCSPADCPLVVLVVHATGDKKPGGLLTLQPAEEDVPELQIKEAVYRYEKENFDD